MPVPKRVKCHVKSLQKEKAMLPNRRQILTSMACVLAIPAAMSIALDMCNGTKVGPETECGVIQACHGSGDDCQLAGAHNPNNCLMSHRIPQKNKWTCVPLPEGTEGANLHCVLEGVPQPCEKWGWCYYTMENLNCRSSGFTCNLPQAMNETAILVPCSPTY